jgi:hypothetical protein
MAGPAGYDRIDPVSAGSPKPGGVILGLNIAGDYGHRYFPAALGNCSLHERGFSRAGRTDQIEAQDAVVLQFLTNEGRLPVVF